MTHPFSLGRYSSHSHVWSAPSPKLSEAPTEPQILEPLGKHLPWKGHEEPKPPVYGSLWQSMALWGLMPPCATLGLGVSDGNLWARTSSYQPCSINLSDSTVSFNAKSYVAKRILLAVQIWDSCFLNCAAPIGALCFRNDRTMSMRSIRYSKYLKIYQNISTSFPNI